MTVWSLPILYAFFTVLKERHISGKSEAVKHNDHDAASNSLIPAGWGRVIT